MKRKSPQRAAEKPPEPASAPPDQETGPEEFGTWLRRQREVREIDLREIADSSKISLRYLQALEEGRFEVLPAPVFARGFLRQYAKYVGLDPEEVLNYFIVAREANQEEEEPDPSKRSRNTHSGPPWGIIAALVALLLIATAGWLWWSGRAAKTTPPPASQSSSSGPSPAASPSLAVSTPSSPGAGGLDANPEVAALSETTREAQEPANPLRVTLDFSGECWIEATVDSETSIAVMKVQGESLQLDAENLVELKLGDASVVQMQVNERPFPTYDGSGPTLRRFSIDLETAQGLVEGNG